MIHDPHDQRPLMLTFVFSVVENCFDCFRSLNRHYICMCIHIYPLITICVCVSMCLHIIHNTMPHTSPRVVSPSVVLTSQDSKLLDSGLQITFNCFVLISIRVVSLFSCPKRFFLVFLLSYIV